MTTMTRPARRQRSTIAPTFPLALLCYGHQGRLIRTLHGRFDASKMDTPIQLAEMDCACWVVLDGNSRVAMILERQSAMTVLPTLMVSHVSSGTAARTTAHMPHTRHVAA